MYIKDIFKRDIKKGQFVIKATMTGYIDIAIITDDTYDEIKRKTRKSVRCLIWDRYRNKPEDTPRCFSNPNIMIINRDGIDTNIADALELAIESVDEQKIKEKKPKIRLVDIDNIRQNPVSNQLWQEVNKDS